MSTHELESKVRELRQLQSLIEEATAEAEAIKDAIKDAMGDAGNCGQGNIKSPGRPSMPPVLTPQPSARPCRMWPSDPLRSPPPAVFVWHKKRRLPGPTGRRQKGGQWGAVICRPPIPSLNTLNTLNWEEAT